MGYDFFNWAARRAPHLSLCRVGCPQATWIKKYPALHIGFLLFLGSACALCWHPVLLLGLLFCKRHLGYFLLVGAACAYAFFMCPSYTLKQTEGTAYFSISSLSRQQSPFGVQKRLRYQGRVKSFDTMRSIPCSLSIPDTEQRPLANCDYLISGTLLKRDNGSYTLKPRKNMPWVPIPKTFSLAECRYKAKEAIRSFLKSQITDPRVLAFFNALAIGEMDEKMLSFEFSRLGLQHILGVSGFQFLLLAFFCRTILRLVFPYRVVSGILLVLLTLYFLFVGGSPPVQRAWIGISLFLIGSLLNLKTSPLNVLGAAAMIEILEDPLVIKQIGFQLSFLCTLAILLLYPRVNALFAKCLPKRSLSEVADLSLTDKHGALLSALIRETLALNCAVHLVALPVLLYTFHTFPLLTLLYNLFVPFLSSLAFLLLLLSLFCTLLFPPLAHLLHSLNTALTSSLLHLTAHPPVLFSFSINFSVPFWFVVLFLFLVFKFSLRADRDMSGNMR